MDTGNIPVQDADSVYLEKTLRHEAMQSEFDDSTSLKVLAMLVVRAWFVSFFVFAFFVLLWIVSGGPGGLANAAADGGGPPAGFGLLTSGIIGSWLVFWLLLLFSKVQEPIGEWRVLLADRWSYSDSVYSTITGVLMRRSLPIAPRMRRIFADPASGAVKNVLELKEGQYSAYVTVFPYGSSLYLGWMMWRRRSGVVLLWRLIADSIGSIFGVVDGVRIMLRTDRPRAMREAVHAASREGIYTAVRQQVVPFEFGFPQGLPEVEPFTKTATPQAPIPAIPVPAPVRAQPPVDPAASSA